jgi:dTDP-4-dehydrorhamnose 3,5-epimerase
MTNGEIPGVILRPLSIRCDPRGWLAELFRSDELPAGFRPEMTYLSMSLPGMVRGPHEHAHQTDLFCFVGPSMFRLYLWDNRPGAPSFRRRFASEFGEHNPMAVVVPPGVVHAYENVGDQPGLVFNAPDRLYGGEHRDEPVDEIRWESDPSSPFRIEG